jgi:hypothetical protein
MVIYEMLSLQRPFENEKGNPQFHITEKKMPLLDLDTIVNNVKQMNSILPEHNDQEIKADSFSYAVLIALFQKCVQFKKSYRPNLEEIKQQLLLVRESANKI